MQVIHFTVDELRAIADQHEIRDDFAVAVYKEICQRAGRNFDDAKRIDSTKFVVTREASLAHYEAIGQSVEQRQLDAFNGKHVEHIPKSDSLGWKLTWMNVGFSSADYHEAIPDDNDTIFLVDGWFIEQQSDDSDS